MSAAPHHSFLTPDDHGPAVTVFAVALACLSASAALVRLWISVYCRIAFRLDDALAFLAFIAILAYTGTLKAAEHYGLGRHMNTLSPTDIAGFFKFMYASHLLGLSVSTTLSKASLVALYKRILSERGGRVSHVSLLCMVAAYGLFSIFALAFQCQLPTPWRFVPSNCPTHGYLFYPVIILNIATDLVLAFWIVPGVWSLEMSQKHRLTVIGLFAARAFSVCVVGIFQMIVTAKAIHQTDQSWQWVEAMILECAVVNLSFVATTLPRIHSYLAGLQAGLLSIGVTDEECRNYSLQRAAEPYAGTSANSKSTANSRSLATSQGIATNANIEVPLKLVPDHVVHNYSRTTHVYGPESASYPGDTHSHDDRRTSTADGQNDCESSQASLRRNVVYEMHEFTIVAEHTRSPYRGTGVV
ncbi:hypothetical protein NA57DRAFT_82313 [Rhizodiscina lignyota]|uniref:Rhodopsin domain-containing protein n=1 Tax=Rhizodiscina lignyota TaxID=1504668 RepID=A0A9P4M0G9_9PEZI|nr:hypothetical protein NA57DRAFT_82313 [Rhizodiscina lignyota]